MNHALLQQRKLQKEILDEQPNFFWETYATDRGCFFDLLR